MRSDQDGDGLGMAPRPGEPETALEPGMAAPRKLAPGPLTRGEPRSGPELTAGEGIAPATVNIPDTSYANVPAPQPGSWSYDFDPSGPARASFNGIVLINGTPVTASGLPLGLDYGGYVNKFRNACFDVWQRGSPINIPAGSLLYAADGWLVQFIGAASQVSHSFNAPSPGLGGFGQLYLLGAAGVTAAAVQQRVESYLAATLAGQICTVQFTMLNMGAAAFTPNLTCYTPTTQDNYASFNTVFSGVPLASVAGGPNVWTRVAYTFAMPMSAQNGVLIQMNFPAGALNSTSNNIALSSADLRATPSLPTGLCPNPPPPELRSIATELAFCQRYFWQPPINAANQPICIGIVESATDAEFLITYPVQMRTVPTMTISAASDFGAVLANFSSVVAATALARYGQNIPGWTDRLSMTAAGGLNALQPTWLVSTTANAKISFSAEL